ncbi:MAG: hypothetical protein K2H90_06890 [Oscillospiraceae bacterium]|nr:hypothetical protein [Oscillospiraceae bacterium]
MTADTKYPILMVHGMGFRDRKRLCYWGRIPKILEQNGARVFFGGQDSNGSVESNAEQLRRSLEETLSRTGAEKVNIIAHSKGGLEARYLISTMGLGDRIATLTTLSTPHNGSLTVDKLLKIPAPVVKFGCKAADIWFKIIGDKNPDTYSAINLFKTSSAEKFNKENPDDPQVYYQSYGFVMNGFFSDITMCIPWLAVYSVEGENDGLLAPRAVRWTNFKGVYRGGGRRGISHCDEVDLRRSPVDISGGGDITDFYLEIISELKNKGF